MGRKMSIKFRTSDGRIVYRAMSINCKEYRAEAGRDHVVERLHCIATTVKPECQHCSLINAVQPPYKDADGGARSTRVWCGTKNLREQ
jgi:hypothetical protein